jgi:hypothetical protein
MQYGGAIASRSPVRGHSWSFVRVHLDLRRLCGSANASVRSAGSYRPPFAVIEETSGSLLIRDIVIEFPIRKGRAP